DNHFVTADPLAKRATEVLIDVALTVRRESGSDSSVVQLNVQTAISNLVNNLGLGDPVQQSDIVVAVEAADGVDSVVLPITELARRGESGVQDITTTKYEYARVDASSITVTVTI